jgi:hypothetical protein
MPKPEPKKRPGRATKAGRAQHIYQLKVTLEEVEPPVWRRVLVPGDIALGILHQVIIWSMDWTDTHLHQFYIRGKRYGDPTHELDEYGDPFEDEFAHRLMDVVGARRTVFHHEYDFGDGWRHRIEVEAVAEEDERYPGHPVCIAGGRSGPPEDCGGPYGYQELLTILADPKHPEYKDRLKWVGGEWDAEAVDVDDINGVLKDIWTEARG